MVLQCNLEFFNGMALDGKEYILFQARFFLEIMRDI
jgi:hypothetical protein